MPPARAIAPPLNPVPAPRPTMGIPCAAASLTMRNHFFGGLGKYDQIGQRLVDAAVVFIEAKVFRPVKVSARSDDVFYAARQLAVHAFHYSINERSLRSKPRASF